MPEPIRISAAEVRSKVASRQAILVCAYDNEEKFQKMRLDGALSFAEFNARAASLSMDQEIIFYCA